jgi:hypothetical protein
MWVPAEEAAQLHAGQTLLVAVSMMVCPERVIRRISGPWAIGFLPLEAEEGATRLPVVTTQMTNPPQPEEGVEEPRPEDVSGLSLWSAPPNCEEDTVGLLLFFPKVSKQPEEALALVGVALMRFWGKAEKAGLESPVR